MERNLFDKIVEDIFHQNRLESHDTLKNRDDVLFAVFSHEPFGFVLPDKKFLQKLPRRNLTKRFFLMNEAKKKWKHLQKQVIDGQMDDFFAQRDTIQKELSPWVIIVKQLDELEKITENYMPHQEVSWDIISLNKNQAILIFVDLWIHHEFENRYRRLYRGKS
jgi:hypothetical protein